MLQNFENYGPYAEGIKNGKIIVHIIPSNHSDSFIVIFGMMFLVYKFIKNPATVKKPRRYK